MARPPRSARAKVAAAPGLLPALERERRKGRRIVFTNGCFDLLHPGHLELFEKAASMGDLLVVGINRDASVRRIKGLGRPLIPFEERALMVAGLAVVDWVVGFDEETPLELIRSLRPDVLVKGGDWTPDRIVGRNLVEDRGGQVATVPLKPGHSSTRLRRRIAPPPGE